MVPTLRSIAWSRPVTTALKAPAAFTGVNSSQWQLGSLGWQLLSLRYALELPGRAPAPRTRRSGDCLG